MKIYVRRRHFKKGKPKRAKLCPLALAMMDACGTHCSVGAFSARTGTTIVFLPASAQRFIRNFDSGKPVKPFAFTIRA